MVSVRIVIEDDLERWPKVSWYGPAQDEIAWDGRFRDGSQAPDGEYFATLKALDRAGNESVQTAVITIKNNLLTLLLPPFDLPIESPLPAGEGEGEGEIPVTSFGGQDDNDASIPVAGLFTAGGLTTVAGSSGTLSFGSANLAAPSSADFPESNILWGAVAIAAIAAFTAEALRRKQTQAREKEKSGYSAKIRANQWDKLMDEWARWQEQRRIANQIEQAERRALAKEDIIESDARAYSARPQEWEDAADRYKSQKAEAARWAGLAAQEQAKQIPNQEKPWWLQAWETGTTFIHKKIIEPLVKALNSSAIVGGKPSGNASPAPSAARRAVAIGVVTISVAMLVNYCDPRESNLSIGATNTAVHADAVTQAALLVTQTVQAIQTNQALIATPGTHLPCTEQYCVDDEMYTDGGLNIRTGAGLTYNVKETLYCGASIKILEISNRRADDGYIWAWVRANTGTEGWAAVSILDKSTPACVEEQTASILSTGASVRIMNGASIEGGNPWSPADNHFGVDVHSIMDKNIYSPFDDRVVSQNSCTACLEAGDSTGNTTHTANPMEKKFNYGYGAMVVIEYPYSELSPEQVKSLQAIGIALNVGQSLYLMEAHLRPGSASGSGTELSAGDTAAVMGTSGNSYGSHLHLEAAVNKSGIAVTPNESTYNYWIKVSGGAWDQKGTRVDPTSFFGIP